MNFSTIYIAALVTLCFLRAEHIIASDVWIYANGEEFRTQIERILAQDSNSRSRGRRAARTSRHPTAHPLISNPSARWEIYRALGGGRLPYLFFGIQSYRLLAWSVGSSGIKATALLLLRGLWRFYTFATVASAIIWAYALCRNGQPGINDYLMVAAASLLVVSAIGTLAGAILATFHMEDFSRYHRKWPPSPAGRLRTQNLTLFLGTVAFLWVSTSSLFILLVTRYSATSGLRLSSWTAALYSAAHSLLGLLSPQSDSANNAASNYGNIIVTIAQLAVAISTVIITANITSGKGK
jgi:hypothetical protein